MIRKIASKKMFEIIPGSAPLLITCEHGGNAELEGKKVFTGPTQPLKEMHWAFDPGSANLTRALCKATNAPGIICNITRLYCDVNRPVGSETLARNECDGIRIGINQNFDNNKRQERIEEVWLPYHLAAAELAAQVNAKTVASIHSFNPIYEGKRRDHVEIGVLSSFDDTFPLKVLAQLEKDGFQRVLLNIPWSGKSGLSKSIACLLSLTHTTNFP